MTRNSFLYPLLFAVSLIGLAPASFAAAPEVAQPIMKVDEIKVGMKGYGLTVFHGTKIEPFNVEVVTINANETPNRSVIWVRCTDERMINTGPVQGMSGSPIYLWADDEEQVLGQGGKLIGAFAFGYANTNECVVGVQPIEYMRQVGKRATAEDRPQISKLPPHGSGIAMMNRLHEASKKADVSELTRARVSAVRDLYAAASEGKISGKASMATPKEAELDARPMRMMVPMAVGSPGIAEVLGPVLTPMGIQPFAADPTALGGEAPKGFEVEDVQLEPGSALVVPFAWGDADLSGAGTVTDVLPDGTVLGFGHAMDGIGVTAIPMATGYVHFIVSLNTISYKRSGTLEMKGALVQDEQAAVAGINQTPFTSAPARVAINIEGQPKYTYDYQVLNHPVLTGPIAGAVVAQSGVAVQGPPMRNTTRFTTTARFSGDREITFDSTSIGEGAQAAAMGITQIVGAITQNPYEPIELESLETTVDIDYGMELYVLNSAKLDRAVAAPGETLTLTLELMSMHEDISIKRFEIKIPEDMPLGETQLVVADAATYTPLMIATQPHLQQIDSLDDFMGGLNELLSPSATSFYTMLQTQRLGVAVNGQRLADLPASKAVILSTNQPKAKLFQIVDADEHELGRVFSGQAQIPLTIRRELGTR